MFHDCALNLHNVLLDSSVVSLLRYELYQSIMGACIVPYGYVVDTLDRLVA